MAVIMMGSSNVPHILRFSAIAWGRMVEAEADKEGQRGVIINTASIAAYEGQVKRDSPRQVLA